MTLWCYLWSSDRCGRRHYVFWIVCPSPLFWIRKKCLEGISSYLAPIFTWTWGWTDYILVVNFTVTSLSSAKSLIIQHHTSGTEGEIVRIFHTLMDTDMVTKELRNRLSDKFCCWAMVHCAFIPSQTVSLLSVFWQSTTEFCCVEQKHLDKHNRWSRCLWTEDIIHLIRYYNASLTKALHGM